MDSRQRTAIHDDELLRHFGYRPELRRVLQSFASFAIVFSFISISTGIFGTYGAVINDAGPRGIWSWPLVCAGQIIVAFVLAALAGRIPISGLSYQWMSRLTNPSFGWWFGWAFLGYGLITAPVVNIILVQAISQLFGFTLSSIGVSLMVIGITIIQAVILVASTRAMAHVNNVAVWTEMTSVIVFGIVLCIIGLASSKSGGGASSLWSTSPVGPAGYWALFGSFTSTVLLGAFTFTGFDSAAALSDETENPHSAVPRGIMRATILSAIIGMLFLIGITIAAPGQWAKIGAAASPVGYVAQHRLGTVVGDIVIICVMVAIFANSLIQTTVASRLIWAISRDGRFPASRLFHSISKRANTPANAIILATIVEIVIAIFFTHLSDLLAASALVPVVIYLFVTLAYLVRRNKFPVQPGGYSLGRFDLPVAVAAVVWCIILMVLLIGPAANHKSALIAAGIFASGIIWWIIMRIVMPDRLREQPKPVEEEPTVGATEA